ncbi:MAG TPA: hypothetical protein VK517_00020 [Cyclobacteriaceae bacterium]|nr:hypothetical protein [Cyclobacteriaceae bacterium]
MQLKITLAILFLNVTFLSLGQTQLLLFNKEKVVARFGYGDDIAYKLKKSTHFTHGVMLGATEFAVITFNDTIPFTSIERISLKGHVQRNGLTLLSKFLITAGVAYFVIDQFNNIIVQGQKPDLEPTVWKPSLVLVASGYALKLARRRSQRIRFPGKLLAVERGSPFYKSDQ